MRIEGDNITFDGFEVTGPSASLYQHPSSPDELAKLGIYDADNALFRHLYIHDINNTANYCKAITAWVGGSLTVQNVLEVNLNCSRIKNSCHVDNIDEPEIIFVNCTFDRLGNDAITDAGGFYRDGGTSDIINCLWTDIGGTGFRYICSDVLLPGLVDVSYSLVCDTTIPPDGGVYFWNVVPNTGVLKGQDPLYTDPFTDHHLQSGSPAINSGDPGITDYDDTPSDMGCYGGPYGDWNFED